MTPDYRDLVIRHLADDLAEAHERIDNLVDDNDAYRALSQQALHALHDLTRERDRLRAQHARLTAEYRAYRERACRQDVAA